MIILQAFIAGLLLSMVLTPGLIHVARRWGIVDHPGRRKVHSVSVPRIGGIAIATGALVPVMMWVPLEREIGALLLGSVVILGFGVWDDIQSLHYKLKLVGQLIGAGIVVIWGGVTIRYVPFFGFDPLPDVVAIPLSLVALLGVTNAINLSDGLDGLAGGASLLSLTVVAILAYLGGGAELTLVTASVMGGIMGFLRYNSYPAWIFMGDGGSQFLGFVLGCVTILLTQETHQALTPAIALLILGLPLLDTVWVMGQRLFSGRSPFAPDKNHIHHKLLALGLDHFEAVFLIYFTQALLVCAAYLLRYQSDTLVVALYLGFCIAVVGAIQVAQASGWRVRVAPGAPRVGLLQGLRALGRRSLVPSRILHQALNATVLLGVLVVGRDVGVNVAAAAAALLVVGIVALRVQAANLRVIARLSYYFLGTVVIYHMQFDHALLNNHAAVINIHFIAMAVLVGVGIRLAQKDRYSVSTLDFLVLFLALIVPNLPELPIASSDLAHITTKIIIFYYAVDFVFSTLSRRTDVSWFAIPLALAVLAVGGML